MSTKRKRTILLIAFAQVVSIAACRELCAQSAADDPASQSPARPVIQKPLTREDAELMLREAHGMIEQGRLDEADKLISRVEHAHVQFPFFHLGPTAASLRKELSHAQRLRAASKALSHDQSTGSKRYLPFSRNTGGAASTPSDPFLAHNQNSEHASSTLGASPNGDPATSGHRLATVAAPTTLALDSQAHGRQTIDNPFASAGTSLSLPASKAAGESTMPGSSFDYPLPHLASEDQPRNLATVAAPSPVDSVAKGPSHSNSTWALPSAPLPRGSSDQRLADANSGLMPPRHAADEISPNNSSLSGSSAKQQAEEKLVAARKALQSGDIDLAEKLTQAANSLGVPESQYLPDEDRPSLLAWDISQAKQKEARQPQSVAAANPAARYERPSAQTAEIGTQSKDRYADITPTAYGDEAGNDRSSITPVPLPPVGRTSQTPLAAPSSAQPDDGPQMLAALPGKPVEKPAKPEVSSAAEEMPPPGNTSAATNPNASEAATKSLPSPNQSHKSFIDSADEAQQLLVRKIDSEVLKRQSEAVRLREKDSERSLAALHEAQQIVNDSKLPESQKHELLSRIDKTLHDTQEYIKAHGAQIELDKQNQAVLNSVDRDRELKVKLQQKIADQVNEYNSLNHEQRYAESEIVARRLHELAPDDPVVAQVWQESKFLRRERMNDELQDKREDSFWRQLNAVEESAVNPVADNGHEIQYDQKHWSDFVSKRKGSKDRVEHHSERELEIERRLQTPVLLRYDNTPLSEVMNSLSQLANVNIHLDPRGLSQEGVNSDTPVTINLSKEISLKSALNLILEPLHLSYVVSDEVLKITSEQLRDGELYTQTYNVADLVTPIPNFVPSSNIGLQGLINDSMAVAGRGPMGIGGATPAVLVNDRKQRLAKSPSNVLAQQLGSQPASSDGLTQPNVPVGSGPGGMGAAANADFDSLIDLITSTVATDTWAENGGGQAEIRPFPTNLSLVISQTQAVHEQIADLLQQLRRLQDLQVTIEVRFITLNDNFFERIGVDFDMNIVDKHIVGATPVPGGINNIPGQPANNIQSATVGVLQSGPGMLPTFTTDLDVPFRQGSFDASLPPFATFDPNTAATMGFAILSDIEAYFLIQAAQSDSRTNVLEAPKVTLFNGQQAFVADASQRPFVIGVIPVVGEFASAQQPVIVVLNEGTMMSIQAVVSDDRRYVRMTIVPFFSQIGNVDTFTFAGSSSSTSSSSSATDKTGNDTTSDKKDNSSSNNSTGVTVQLPTFSFVSVVTTVSVPDGGTVLLGGIKRLREGRNEVGVPLLSKVPYINRLFRNVGIGRQTESLMMMVTPRIIIQEEEEEKLGIAAPTP